MSAFGHNAKLDLGPDELAYAYAQADVSGRPPARGCLNTDVVGGGWWAMNKSKQGPR